jgi:hypothetical protein
MSFYYPQVGYISDITQGQNTIVEFNAPHDFTIGEFISFRISKANGMVEMNNLQTIVDAITTFTVTVPINSITFTPWINALTMVARPAIAVPVATGNVPGSSPMVSNLKDSFDNKPYNPLT